MEKKDTIVRNLNTLCLSFLLTINGAASVRDTVYINDIQASSWHEGHWPDYAIDGNNKTYWSDNQDLAKLELEIAAPLELSGLSIAFENSDSLEYSFRVEISDDGEEWQRVLMATSKTGVQGLQSFEFNPVFNVGRLRIVSLGNSKNDWIKIENIRINGAALTYEVLELNPWQAPLAVQTQQFGPVEPLTVWGADMRRPSYFREWLPALFERTLVMDELDLNGGQLSWIFTGQRGGLTILLHDEHLEIVERFYDTPAYLQMEPDSPGSTSHPQWITGRRVYPYTGKPESVTVRRDHKLGLTVLMNGQPVARDLNLLTFDRHQLNLQGEDPQLKGRMLSPQIKSVQLSVDTEQRHQTIIGFGGIPSIPAYHELSEQGKQKWWQMLAEYNLLVHRENPNGMMLNEKMDNWDDLDDARPHYYADNFPNGEISDFGYLEKVREIGGIIVFEFWELPPWVSEGHQLQPEEVDLYCDAIIRYCKLVEKHTGAPPEIVGVQNEIYQKMEVFHAMAITLRQKLDRAGFKTVRIHMPDDGFLNGGIERVKGLQESDKAWEVMDYSSVHMYDYQFNFTNPDAYDTLLNQWRGLVKGKPLLSHEISFHRKRWQTPDYNMALSVGQLYHKNMVLADAAVLGHCWTLLTVEQPSYGWTRSLMVPDRANGFVPIASSNLLRVFGSFSRRVHEGMQRVTVNHDLDDLQVSAYYDDNGRATLVALNRGMQPLSLNIDWPGVQFDVMELTDPYHANSVEDWQGREGEPVVVQVDPGAIITLSNVKLHEVPDDLLTPQ